MGYFTFGQLRKFINSMSDAGVDDDTPVIVKIDDNKICTLTGDDVYTDLKSNHPELECTNIPDKRILFIQI